MELDLAKILEEEKAARAAAEAERQAALEAMLANRYSPTDTTPLAAMLDDMSGGKAGVIGAQAVAQQAKAQEQDLLDELIRPENKAQGALALQAAKLQADTALDREGLNLKRQELAVKEAKPQALTKGQEALDRNFAKTYEDFTASGGLASVERQLGALDDAKNILRKEKNITGASVGAIPKTARDFLNPKSSAVQEQVEQVVQSSLRATLGAQFTEKEGQMVIKRAYNPALSQEENIKRIDAVKREIKKMAEAKDAAARYFEENGTLAGYRGPKADDIKAKLVAGDIDTKEESSSALEKLKAIAARKK